MTISRRTGSFILFDKRLKSLDRLGEISLDDGAGQCLDASDNKPRHKDR